MGTWERFGLLSTYVRNGKPRNQTEWAGGRDLCMHIRTSSQWIGFCPAHEWGGKTLLAPTENSLPPNREGPLFKWSMAYYVSPLSMDSPGWLQPHANQYSHMEKQSLAGDSFPRTPPQWWLRWMGGQRGQLIPISPMTDILFAPDTKGKNLCAEISACRAGGQSLSLSAC